MLTTRKKLNVITEHKAHDTDTGSTAVQIALLTREIEELTAHLKQHPQDNHSRRGLLGMVSKRRKLLKYLEDRNPRNYGIVTKKLGLKK